MKLQIIAAILLITALGLTGCAGSVPNDGPAPYGPAIPSPEGASPTPVVVKRILDRVADILNGPSYQTTPVPGGEITVETVAEDLSVPWSLAFAPDGRLFVTERPGRLRVIENGQLRAEPLATFDVAAVGEAGLMGLALDPDFASNNLAYVYYTYVSGSTSGVTNRVERFTINDQGVADRTVILDNIPAAFIHDGGRLAFGPDGKLYITTGDASSGDLAQDLDSLGGKILRINGDGSIPEDNPFPGSPVYTYGHRNPEGLAWYPVTGQLYATEHGPTGQDEINIIEAGRNYGWPEVAGFGGGPEFVDPLAEYNPAIAPAGAAFFTGPAPQAWNNNFFFACLRGQQLRRVAFAPPDFRQVQEQESLFEGEYGRLRAVAMGPDGFLYFSTSNRDGRGDPVPEDDRILRIVSR